MALVQIIGAGPGAEDLITVRGAKALQEADYVLYAGSLVNPQILSYCRKDCEIQDSSPMNLDEQIDNMASRAAKNLKVVRLHTGDPAVFGAINEQIRRLKALNIDVQIIPGVSSVFGAAAALGLELTAPEVSQSVVLTRTAGRTPMPENERPANFAKTGATLVFFLSTGKAAALAEELHKEGGLPLDTPAAVVYRATWPEQKIIQGTLETIGAQTENEGFGRQALIFVGKALQAAECRQNSKLYQDTFSHGYRNFLPQETFRGTCALYAFSRQGLAKAKEIMQGLQLPCTLYSVYADEKALPIEHGKSAELVQKNWTEFDAHIFIGAAGIAVRSIAPCLNRKYLDPAVVSCSDTGNYVISLASGHLGGANRLARKISRITGGQACISTATDSHNLTGIDEIAMLEQARIINPQAIKTINSALLHGKPLAFAGNADIYARYLQNTTAVFCKTPQDNIDRLPCIFWDEKPLTYNANTDLCIESNAFILGIGCKKGTEPHILRTCLTEFLKSQNLTEKKLAGISSCILKQDEPAILELAQSLSIPLTFYGQEELDAVPVPNPSAKVSRNIGTKSVAEASCLLAAGYPKTKRLYTEKTRYADSITFALARLPHGCRGSQNTTCKKHTANAPAQGIMSVVGLGSGSHKHITPEVLDIINTCDVIAGYTPYVDFIRDIIGTKPVIQNGMMGEMARCEQAMAEAAAGKHVCMVCSGDPGILAMAGLLLELRKNTEFSHIQVNIYPGITSANIAAASLGAPLQNGFCLISLSDLLVPTDEVRQNLAAAAKSALPISLYNPAGKKRRDLLHEAVNIFTEARGKDTLCAYVKNAGRENESKWTGTLENLPTDEIDMSTLLIIGSRRTLFDGTYLYEARGYMDKYGSKN